MRRLGLLLAALSFALPAGASAQINLTSENGFLFDIQDTFAPGSLGNGTTDAYDTCYQLRVGGLEYSTLGGGTTMSLGGRQVEFPDQILGGLAVRRLVYVPATGGDYARYLEVLENMTPSAITTTVEVYGNLGSDSGTVVTGSSSGDSVVTLADGWFGSDDSTDSGGDPSLAHVFSSASPSVSPSAVSFVTDNLSYSWAITVPAGGRAVIMHFAVQARDRATSLTEARRLVEVPDDTLMGVDDFLDDVINFGIATPGAPRVRFISPFEAEEGSTVTMELEIEDPEGDDFTFSWDLDDDGTFGEMPGVDSVMIAAADGPDGVRVGVEATDSGGHTAQRYRSLRVVNVEPRISSGPPLSTSVGVDIAYQIEVEDPAGELDPPTFALVQGPDRMSVSDTGLVSWVPTEGDVTVAGETIVVEVSVDDGDEGVGTQRWEMMVSPNRAPSPPIPAYPIDRVAILDPMPRLAAQNSEDVDLDPLTYTFQLDTSETFDSGDLQEWTLDEMPGFTSVSLESPLPLDRLYFWRVRANDGTANSEWRETSFWVVYDPLLPPLDAGVDAGGTPDAGGGADAGPMTMDGGGCSAAPTRRSAAPLFGLLLALVILRRRR